jgi:hypothetical protein
MFLQKVPTFHGSATLVFLFGKQKETVMYGTVALQESFFY